jgi:hypothetical protein
LTFFTPVFYSFNRLSPLNSLNGIKSHTNVKALNRKSQSHEK